MIDSGDPLLEDPAVSSNTSGNTLTAPSVSASGQSVVYRSFHKFGVADVHPSALSTPSGAQHRYDLWGAYTGGAHCSMITKHTASGNVGSTTSTFDGDSGAGWAASTTVFKRRG